MKNKILLILGIIASFCLAAYADQWKLHPTYSEYLQRIIDTPKYTYLLSGNQPYVDGIADFRMITNSIFRYDKEEKETEWLGIHNKLSAPVVVAAEYNFDKSYLMVGYDNGDIDLIYDNGKVVNVPALKVADSSFSKNINSITFVPGGKEAYVATGFGYITIDDEKGEIGTSRIVDKNINSAVSFGNKVYIGSSDGLYRLEPHGSADGERIEGIGAVGRMLVSGNRLYIYSGSDWSARVDYIDANDAEGTPKELISTYLMGIERAKDGIMVTGHTDIWKINNDGSSVHYSRPQETSFHKTFGYDGRKFWVDMGLDGVRQMEGEPENASSWKATGEIILPNAANCYKSPNMAYTDKYGMLVRNHGFDYNFNSPVHFNPDYITGYKDGKWTPLSIAALAPEKLDVFRVYNPTGLAVDPLDPEMVYSGSVFDGIFRLNLADPSRSLRLGLITDAAAGMPGYIGITTPPSKPDLKTYTPFGTPGFDNQGYLWIPYYNIETNLEEIWYWSPEDRKATTSSSNYRPLKKLDIPNLTGSNSCAFIPLRVPANKNILVITVVNNNILKVIDHKGTIDNQKDDQIYTFTKNIYDQDGTLFECDFYRALYEDPTTGNVWVGTDKGVFYFNPKNLKDVGDTKIQRVKVPRNDGTSLADYLLDGACVNMITTDGQGRKWFATNGGGITVTSATGAQVLKTYTTENSLLPSDQVFGLCYNPAANSMMVSTDSGLAEVFLSESSVGEDSDSGAVVYPNPVRPDYYGYVNIEGLEEGALVKITDSAGNLVKELGFADDGTIRWDVTNLNNKRVRSGVYYVLASGGAESTGFSAAAKILVVN